MSIEYEQALELYFELRALDLKKHTPWSGAKIATLKGQLRRAGLSQAELSEYERQVDDGTPVAWLLSFERNS